MNLFAPAGKLARSGYYAANASVTAKRAALALIAGLLTGCASPAYYHQAIAGHLDLMHARQPVSEATSRPDLTPEMAARLRLAGEITDFAERRLLLPAGDSYSRIVITGREAVTWNVVAAPEFSTEPRRWCFPVAGCVAYRGYFARSKAERFAARMRDKSHDVIVSPAVAYSTLGWFEDPLLDTMLRNSEAELAAILFHELAHRKLYLRGDTAFSEAFASFVEETGLGLWLTERQQPGELESWRRRRAAGHQLADLLNETRERLDVVYASAAPPQQMRRQKREVFASLREKYAMLVNGDWGGIDYHGAWMAGDLNNAHLALAGAYAAGSCAFEALHRQAGGSLEAFFRLAQDQAALPQTLRRQWLETPCSAFASGGDL